MPRCGHRHPGGVGDQGLFEADLGPVGETGHHVGVLTPVLGEPALGGRRPVLVLQTLDVARDQRTEADAANEADQVHLDARLITVAASEDHAGRLGAEAEQRSDGSVDLGVHQHQVLAVLDRGQRQVAAVLDRSGGIHDRIDRAGRHDRREVVADDRDTGSDRRLGLGHCAHPPGTGHAGLGVGPLRLGHRTVHDRRHRHAGGGVHDLVHQPAAHESRTDQGHPNRASLLLAALQRCVDQDHERAPAVSGCQP